MGKTQSWVKQLRVGAVTRQMLITLICIKAFVETEFWAA